MTSPRLACPALDLYARFGSQPSWTSYDGASSRPAYDGRIVVGVWVGRPDGAPLPGLMGTDVAVPILGDVFVRAGGVTRLPAPPRGLDCVRD